MDEPNSTVFMVEWATILRDLQRARPDVPDSLVGSSAKSLLGDRMPGGYSLSNPRSVAIVAAQKFAADFELPKGRNSTVLPLAVAQEFWTFIENALADAILVWDREITQDAFNWAVRKQ